jgi:23S rRNA maturation-related 3'-5' exoribonuclease YhaM
MAQTTTPMAPVSDHYYIVKSCAKKTSTKGDMYLDMTFQNAAEELPA